MNAGGDLAVRGIPEQGTWPVGVETPDGPLTLGLSSGALATSGSDRRKWMTANGTSHHLIDPRSGRPSDSDLERVTVCCGGQLVAEHARCWARHQTIADPAHLDAARVLRRERLTVLTPTQTPVEQRSLTDYDAAFGLGEGAV